MCSKLVKIRSEPQKSKRSFEILQRQNVKKEQEMVFAFFSSSKYNKQKCCTQIHSNELMTDQETRQMFRMRRNEHFFFFLNVMNM